MEEAVLATHISEDLAIRRGFLVLQESFSEDYLLHHLDPVEGEYIADIMIVYDCCARSRVPHSPVLLRLENYDLVLLCSASFDLRAWKGAVPNHIPLRNNIEVDCCWAWISDKSVRYMAGETISSITIEGTAENLSIVIIGQESTCSFRM